MSIILENFNKSFENMVCGYLIGRTVLSIGIVKTKKEFEEKLSTSGYKKVKYRNIFCLKLNILDKYNTNRQVCKEDLMWHRDLSKLSVDDIRYTPYTTSENVSIDPVQSETIFNYILSNIDDIIESKMLDFEILTLVNADKNNYVYVDKRYVIHKYAIGKIYDYKIESAVKIKWDYNMDIIPHDISPRLYRILLFNGKYYYHDYKKYSHLQEIEKDGKGAEVFTALYRKKKIELLNI